MAKRLQEINLVQGDKIIPVSVKTTTENYLRKLVNDYRRLGKLTGGNVEIVFVKPQFG